MMSTNNVLSPAHGEPITVPSQDVVLGLYYMTREKVNARGEGMIFSDVSEVHRAYSTHAVALQAKVKVRVAQDPEIGEGFVLVETTVGRALLSEILPRGMTFSAVNKTLTKKEISNLINTCYRQVGLKESVVLADQLMYTGFNYATRSGVSIGINDLVIPGQRDVIDDFPCVGLLKHCLKNLLVSSTAEVLLDQQLHCLRHGGVIEQDGAENRLLCFQVLGWELRLREIN